MIIEELRDEDAGADGADGADGVASVDHGRIVGTREAEADDGGKKRTTEEMRAELERLRAVRREMLARAEDDAESRAIVDEAEALEPRYYDERALEYTNGDEYVGECVDETRHGRGRHVCSTGDVYDGYWRDDKRHGRGTMTFKSGLKYEGEWEDDKTCGRGRCEYVNGDVYEGEWKNDHRWGWGTQRFASGDVYEGEWVDDIVEGNGMYTYADGSTFNGATLSGSRVRGRYAAKDGSVEYDGEWRGDYRHGRGKFAAVGSYKYIGQWRDDLRHGRGKCELATGSTYDGEWRDDQYHGKGVLKTATFEYVGDFEGGRRKGQGVCKFTDLGEEYRGAFDEDAENGKGKRLYADGTIYQGEWCDGKRHGKGACTYANGDEYQGEWVRDERHGYGVCVFADGTKYRGEWERDCWCQSTAEPAFTKVFGPGVVKARAGEASMIGIEARDELKNKRLSGGDIFTVKLTHVDSMETDDELVEYGTVTDNGDGTYVAYYTCTVAGAYQCEVIIGNDEQCGNSPYDVVVEPARASAKHCVVEGDGTRRAAVSQRASFTIKARDEFDNDVFGNLSEQLPLQISVTDVNGHEIKTKDGVKIEDDGRGRFVASYEPVEDGFYRLVVSCRDVLMGSSPYALRVHASSHESKMPSGDARVPEGSIAPVPNDLARDWEIIAKADFTRDGDDFGWDTESEDEETAEDKAIRENPDVAVITNYEDLYKVGRLQKRMKEKRAEEQAKKLADMKAKLEVLSVARSESATVENTSARAASSLKDVD
jgi:hypothetical protein